MTSSSPALGSRDWTGGGGPWTGGRSGPSRGRVRSTTGGAPRTSVRSGESSSTGKSGNVGSRCSTSGARPCPARRPSPRRRSTSDTHSGLEGGRGLTGEDVEDPGGPESQGVEGRPDRGRRWPEDGRGFGSSETENRRYYNVRFKRDPGGRKKLPDKSTPVSPGPPKGVLRG